MPACTDCKNMWTWKEAFTKQFNFVILKCPYCESDQYYSARYRKRSSVLQVLIIFFIMTGNMFLGPSYITLILLFLWLLIFLFVNPFMIELANEEEPIF